MRASYVYTCIVHGCNSKKSSRGDLMFHTVGGKTTGIGRERAKRWLAACKRLDLLDPLISLNTKFICSLHFEKRMYGATRLKKNAYPTLRLPTNSNISTINSPSTSKNDYRTEVVSDKNKNDIAESTKDDTSLAKALQTIIKYEPPQPSEITIEEEQIGYHYGAKRRRVYESGRENLGNVHNTVVTPMGANDQSDLTLEDEILKKIQFIKVEAMPMDAHDQVDLIVEVDKPENISVIKVEPIPMGADDQVNLTMEDDIPENLTKVETMDADDEVKNIDSFINSEVTNNPIKEEKEDTEREYKNELLKEANLEAYIHSELASNRVKEESIEKQPSIQFEKEEKFSENIDMPMAMPSKRKLKRLLRFTKNNINKKKNKKKEALKRFLLGCDMYLSPKLTSIVKGHLNSKGKEFTNDYKLFCLNLYISNPTTYIFLSQVLYLPTENELIKSYFPMECKINKQMLEILAAVSKNLSAMDKECVLTIGEIRLKRSIFYDAKADRMFGLHEIDGNQKPCGACFAYTVMLQGVCSDWKLLIGFSLTLLNNINPDLNKWLTDTISQVFQLGFQVRAINCPVMPTFMQFASLLGVGVAQDKCYFEVDGKKVYFIFDIGSILKKARNALCKKLFMMNEKRASWTCLEQLYQVDHKNVKRYAPRLTKLHIKPKKHILNNLRHASEVMDSSVAAALNIYAAKKQLKPYFGTIQFILMLSRVYKVLNSDKPIPCSDEEKCLFYEMRSLLNSIVVCDKKTVCPVNHHKSFITSLLLTMGSIFHMGEDIDFVIQRKKLTSSCRFGLQQFYSVIRKLSGHSERVTCLEYLSGFRRCFLFHALTLAEKKDRAVAVTNNAAFLDKYETFVKKNKIYKMPKREYLEAEVWPALQYASEETRFIHFCSFMLKKCVEKHDCPKLREYASSSVVPLKSSKGETVGLKVPPAHFLIYCNNIENYLEYLLNEFIGGNVSKKLVKRLKEIYFDKPCNCFPVNYLLNIFVKLRIILNNLMNRAKWMKKNSKVATATFEFIRM